MTVLDYIHPYPPGGLYGGGIWMREETWYVELSLSYINSHYIALCWSCITAGARYISISSYQASRDDELSFVRGAVVKVLKKYIDGWWLVRYANINN